MADPYSDLRALPVETQEVVAAAMEARCVDPAQMAMRRAYLGPIRLAPGAHAVEFGSGTGHVTRELIEVCGATEALGIEPSPVMVARARQLHAGVKGLIFSEGDAAETGLNDATADLVVMHTLLCHAIEPARLLAEALRILKPGGRVAVCEGDYDTATVALGRHDPLDAAVRWMIRENVHDRWITRRLPSLLSAAGFAPEPPRVHAYLADAEAAYFRTVIERALAGMEAAGLLTSAGAAGLAAEAEGRIAGGRFFGFMSYVSVLARKPG